MLKKCQASRLKADVGVVTVKDELANNMVSLKSVSNGIVNAKTVLFVVRKEMSNALSSTQWNHSQNFFLRSMKDV